MLMAAGCPGSAFLSLTIVIWVPRAPFLCEAKGGIPELCPSNTTELWRLSAEEFVWLITIRLDVPLTIAYTAGE
jgi:hypothetical protein